MVEKSYKQTLINKYWQICWTIKRMDPCDRGNGHRAQKENWQVQKYVLNYYNLFHDRQWYFRCAIWTQKVVWLTRRIARIWPVRGPHWQHDEEDTQSTLCARYQTVDSLDPWRTQRHQHQNVACQWNWTHFKVLGKELHGRVQIQLLKLREGQNR